MARRVRQYTGPYERWVFGKNLGRPFSFPAIRNWSSRYFAALMDSPTALPDVSTVKFRAEPGVPVERVDIRYPPLWNDGQGLSVRPFCFYDPAAEEEPASTSIEDWIDMLLELLDQHIDNFDASSDNRARPRYRINFPINPATWTQDYDPAGPVGDFAPQVTPPKAIIAVIDDGIPFANRTYLNSAGKTRISNCWLQSARSPGAGAVPFGRELSNGEIDALRTEHGRDEKAIYYAAGAIDADLPEMGNYLLRETTHGAHILSTAAGKTLGKSQEPSQDDIEIIAVQLPNTIAWDTSGFGKEMYMLSALHYVFERAKRIAEAHGIAELPLVVNFSYGWSGGRHDGQSEMDTAIQELLESRRALAPTYLVMPSGNTYLDKMHANFQESEFANDEISIGWQVQPDDRTSSYVEMWLPEGLDPDGYTFEVTPPRGVSFDATPSLALRGAPRFPRGDPRNFVNLRVGGAAVGQLSVDKNRGTRWRAMVALAPSMPLKMPNDDPPRWAASGRWTLTLKRTAAADRLPEGGYINVWAQRDDDPSELRTGGRQSYLVELDKAPTQKPALPEYKQPLSLVRGFGSMNGVANAELVTRVAGYIQSTGQPAPYSSAGGLLNTNGPAPEIWGQHVDICAVSDRSPVLPGTVAQGVYSGARSILIGTSGAAPQVARSIVRALADGLDPMSGMATQVYNYENPIKNVHLKARLGTYKSPPLWAGE
ncbi:hypothetical protein SAMN05444273_10436 [Litoreibacter ascidiaceicola]|uniref:Subtilase family protein n=1 Tax=Litoreibacter ascidiaceicola TaxID=1486859 RepID=A0A1M4Z4A8_9RHOB|nr:hypothetical protein [Litoreibacter ascidiaceicola]SHF12899.1 hypothetical protein SAMN05444273_10436 [Litoreibacter ascidiaceicola]